LGKALNDPITGLTALRRVGITFSESQEKTIKTMQNMGDMAGAQKLILKELESQFGGLARAAAEIGTGPLVQFQNRIGDIQERIGGKLLPAITDIADEFDKWLTPERIDKMVDGFDDWAKGSKVLVGWLRTVGKVGSEVIGLFTSDTVGDGFLSDPKVTAEIKNQINAIIKLQDSIGILKKDYEKFGGIQRHFSEEGRENNIALHAAISKEIFLREKLGEIAGENFGREGADLKEISKALDVILNKKTKEIATAAAKAKAEAAAKAAALKAAAQTEPITPESKSAERTRKAKEAAAAKEFEDMQTRNTKVMHNNAVHRENERIAEQNFEDSLTEIRAQGAADRLKNDEIAAEKRKQLIQSIQSTAFSGASQLTSALGNLAAVRGQNELKAAEKAGASEQILDGIRKKSFERQKSFSLKSAYISLAQAALGGYSQKPFIPVGLAAGSLALLSGGIQIKAIKAQKYARGGDFVTNGPQPIIVGDNPGGRERVQVTPLSSQNVNGPQGSEKSILIEGDTFHIGDREDLDSIVSAIQQTRQEKIAAMAELLNETQLQEVIAV